jgi:hypothetical protein
MNPKDTLDALRQVFLSATGTVPLSLQEQSLSSSRGEYEATKKNMNGTRIFSTQTDLAQRCRSVTWHDGPTPPPPQQQQQQQQQQEQESEQKPTAAREFTDNPMKEGRVPILQAPAGMAADGTNPLFAQAHLSPMPGTTLMMHITYSREDSELLVRIQDAARKAKWEISGIMSNQGEEWFAAWLIALRKSHGVCVFFTEGNAEALNNQGVGYIDKFVTRMKCLGDEAPLYMEAKAILALKAERPGFKIYVVDGIKFTPEQLAFNLMNDAPSFGPVDEWRAYIEGGWRERETIFAEEDDEILSDDDSEDDRNDVYYNGNVSVRKYSSYRGGTGCFAESTSVQKGNGQVVCLHELKVGDSIHTIDVVTGKDAVDTVVMMEQQVPDTRGRWQRSTFRQETSGAEGTFEHTAGHVWLGLDSNGQFEWVDMETSLEWTAKLKSDLRFCKLGADAERWSRTLQVGGRVRGRGGAVWVLIHTETIAKADIPCCVRLLIGGVGKSTNLYAIGKDDGPFSRGAPMGVNILAQVHTAVQQSERY